MKVSILAAALLLGTSHFALAADPALPMEEPPLGFSWTGGYAGVNIGYGWGHSEFDDDGWSTLGGQSFGGDADGVLGGVQAGYNWQAGSLVVGVEGELGYLNLDSGLQGDGVFTSALVDGGFYAGLSARLGYAIDRTLLYAKAGGVYHGGEFSVFYNPTIAGPGLPNDVSVSETVGLGYQIGGGIEHAVTDNWTLKLEYAYFDFGSETVTGFDVYGSGPWNYTADLNAHTLKIGANFKF